MHQRGVQPSLFLMCIIKFKINATYCKHWAKYVTSFIKPVRYFKSKCPFMWLISVPPISCTFTPCLFEPVDKVRSKYAIK